MNSKSFSNFLFVGCVAMTRTTDEVSLKFFSKEKSERRRRRKSTTVSSKMQVWSLIAVVMAGVVALAGAEPFSTTTSDSNTMKLDECNPAFGGDPSKCKSHTNNLRA